MLKAILFDLDDTLIDWAEFDGPWEVMEDIHLHNVFEYIHKNIHPMDNVNAYIEEYIKRMRQAWMDARTTLRAPHLGTILIDTAEALGVPPNMLKVEACLDAYAWQAVKKTRVFPDVVEALTLLKERGIIMGIVTNAFHPMGLRDKELAQHGILDFFPSCRISAADFGYLKPHREIFETALKCLDVSPDEAIFVGDNLVADVAGAQSAGMLGVLRVTKNYDPSDRHIVQPDAMIHSLLELPALIDDWFPE